MKKQGIIFDMDGTLWDSAANVAESWNEAIRQDGRLNKALTEADIKGVMGKTMDVIADILFPELEKLVPTLHMASVYALLCEFPSADAVANAHLTRLSNLLFESSKGLSLIHI